MRSSPVTGSENMGFGFLTQGGEGSGGEDTGTSCSQGEGLRTFQPLPDECSQLSGNKKAPRLCPTSTPRAWWPRLLREEGSFRNHVQLCAPEKLQSPGEMVHRTSSEYLRTRLAALSSNLACLIFVIFVKITFCSVLQLHICEMGP